MEEKYTNKERWNFLIGFLDNDEYLLLKVYIYEANKILEKALKRAEIELGYEKRTEEE